jgi:Tfp pilus assembly protein PilX
MKRGQILLITVMLLATLMTVVLSVSFQSVTETQITKLEEESQKALAAAEAALEAALKQGVGTVTIGEGALSSLTGFTGSASVETATSTQFTTSLIQKDGSYTFYLEDYSPVTKTFSGSSLAENIALCFQSGTTNPALEITLIKDSGVKKYVVDPDSRISNAPSGSAVCTANSSFSYSFDVSGSDISDNTRLMIVRVLYASTKLFLSRTSDLPLQGKTAISEASTATGVSKKITLFQSYPQIPGEFFSTSF